MRYQVSALRENANALQEQLDGMRHEMQVKDIQAERKRRALVEVCVCARARARVCVCVTMCL